MQQSGRTYIAIDLKSYYASVECMAAFPKRASTPMNWRLTHPER